ncbi:MAG: protein kinase domain-containing protein [Polyangiales bacterium]
MRTWRLVLDGAERPIELPSFGPTVFGRALDARVPLPPDDETASRYHAAIELFGDVPHLRDLGSRNGSYVNDRPVQATPLAIGDRVRLGKTVFRVDAKDISTVYDNGPASYAATVFAPSPTPVVAVQPQFVSTARGAHYRCEECGADGPPPNPALANEALLSWICMRCADRRRTDPSTWRYAVPTTIGDYDVLAFLARGGMSCVYEGRHRNEGLHVTIKVLVPQGPLDPVAVKRFVKEQRVTTALRHARVIRCFDVGSIEGSGQLYLVNEYLAGGDAESISHAKSDLPTVFQIATDLFQALAYAHQQGVVHRDVKPSNVFLTRPDASGRPRARLADFGLAKNFTEAGGTVLTREGEVVGSPCFMAPEQTLGFSNVGPAADVYAAATTIYYMLTRELPLVLPGPLDRMGVAQICLAGLADERMPVSSRRRDVPADVASWLDVLCARRPEQRGHISAAQVAEMFASHARS